ncbi:hypothetical protein [Hymenobacter saemangeumensis]
MKTSFSIWQLLTLLVLAAPSLYLEGVNDLLRKFGDEKAPTSLSK